jgi:hypothetical protein
VTAGFKGDVGVVPRQFLRAFVDVMDLVEENADYDPMTELGFKMPKGSASEEQHADERPHWPLRPTTTAKGDGRVP